VGQVQHRVRCFVHADPCSIYLFGTLFILLQIQGSREVREEQSSDGTEQNAVGLLQTLN